MASFSEYEELRCVMTAEEIEPIFRTSNRLIRETDCGFHRYLAEEIDWNEPFACIMGARGAGKTTLMLQHIKETFGEGSDKAIYMEDITTNTRK